MVPNEIRLSAVKRGRYSEERQAAEFDCLLGDRPLTVFVDPDALPFLASISLQCLAFWQQETSQRPQTALEIQESTAFPFERGIVLSLTPGNGEPLHLGLDFDQARRLVASIQEALDLASSHRGPPRAVD